MSATGQVLVEARRLVKTFPARRRASSSGDGAGGGVVQAVSGVSFEIRRGEILGLVGESGCGKSTTGALLALLERPDSGSIHFEGQEITHLRGQALRSFRRRVQIVFQDPYESLDPRFTVEDTLTEPLLVHGIGGTKGARRDIVRQTLARVELRPPDTFIRRHPHDLSGGQRQRVAIARAIILEPHFLVADEPVSMLDVSVRAGVLNLMRRLKDELGMTYLFITHDLAVARYMCDRVVVMYLGKIVELGRTERVLRHASHPYAQLLLSSVPAPDPDVKPKQDFSEYSIPDAADVPLGCRFHPRCPFVMDVCRESEPPLIPVAEGHQAACYMLSVRPADERRANACDGTLMPGPAEIPGGKGPRT